MSIATELENQKNTITDIYDLWEVVLPNVPLPHHKNIVNLAQIIQAQNPTYFYNLANYVENNNGQYTNLDFDVRNDTMVLSLTYSCPLTSWYNDYTFFPMGCATDSLTTPAIFHNSTWSTTHLMCRSGEQSTSIIFQTDHTVNTQYTLYWNAWSGTTITGRCGEQLGYLDKPGYLTPSLSSHTNFDGKFGLFAYYNKTSQSFVASAQTRIYGLTIQELVNGVVTTTHDLKPCIIKNHFVIDANGNKMNVGDCGFIDIITNKFYGSMTNTPFISNVKYEPLSYIQSTGTQCINTGYITNSDGTSVFEERAQYTTISATQYNGCTGNYTQTTWGVSLNGYWVISGWETASSADTNTHDFRVYFNGAEPNLDVDGTFVDYGGTNGDYELPIYIFCSGGTSSKTEYCSKKLYSFKITDGGTVVRNFVPCKLIIDIPATQDSQGVAREAGTIGLWDTVNNIFYGNAGTGVFIAGSVQ